MELAPAARRLPRPTYSGVVATLALVVALSGTSYAAAKVNGRNLVNRSVTAAKIKPNTLTAKQMSRKLVVPRARSVDDLVIARGKASGGRRVAGDAEGSPMIGLTAGETRTIIDKPPFEVRAECEDGKLTMFVTSTEAPWYPTLDTAIAGYLGAPYAVGQLARTTVLSGHLSDFISGNAFAALTPAGDVLTVSAPIMGLNVLGFDCVVAQYAISG